MGRVYQTVLIFLLHFTDDLKLLYNSESFCLTFEVCASSKTILIY